MKIFTIYKFREVKQCPKCLASTDPLGVTTKRTFVGLSGDIESRERLDRLNVTCHQCGYGWLEYCADDPENLVNNQTEV
jgi:hypothetical protein